ncbi:DNA repair protein XRCC4-like isoform X2 [Punica granatum]|uniref:DNA repair protein XRCC4-like isoform X2 n=1 Tax=Punica granatum TaxID=22663 RepID=A0A6P8DZ12_PUNGR|nr:DNA repair protein XRCC4-like isoform X2 [Punica granatum]
MRSSRFSSRPHGTTPTSTSPSRTTPTLGSAKFRPFAVSRLGFTASEEEVRERAAQWDQPEADYIELAERYLGFQQPGSVYKFTDAENRTKLEWRWKCQPSPNPQQTNSGILNFLMDANIRLSEEVVRKTKSFERLKVETENAWHRVNVSAMRRQSLCLQSMQRCFLLSSFIMGIGNISKQRCFLFF